MTHYHIGKFWHLIFNPSKFLRPLSKTPFFSFFKFYILTHSLKNLLLQSYLLQICCPSRKNLFLFVNGYRFLIHCFYAHFACTFILSVVRFWSTLFDFFTLAYLCCTSVCVYVSNPLFYSNFFFQGLLLVEIYFIFPFLTTRSSHWDFGEKWSFHIYLNLAIKLFRYKATWGKLFIIALQWFWWPTFLFYYPFNIINNTTLRYLTFNLTLFDN